VPQVRFESIGLEFAVSTVVCPSAAVRRVLLYYLTWIRSGLSFQCIKSGGDLSRPATERKPRCSLERGYGHRGKNPPERLPNLTFAGIFLWRIDVFAQFVFSLR
jgi:hypothetical protein